MKYQNPQLRQMLAGQYALGTLRGRARRRFERLVAGDATLRAELSAWERRLAGLNRRIRPVVPRQVVWAAIDRHIKASQVAPLPVRGAAPGAGPWRALALVASLACVALSLALWREMQRPPQVVTQTVRVEVPQPVPYVALLRPGASEAQFLVALMPEKHMLKVAASGSYPADYQRQCLELWVLDDAGKPHALGVMPEQPGEMEMPIPRDMPMPKSPTLAVSVEPKGGSPTGLPTGPVITTGRALRTS
jgi:anti-sigma-K factor RskA